MKPNELYQQSARIGLRLEARDGRLVVSPKARCSPDLLQTLRQHKEALLAWLPGNVPFPGWQVVPPSDLALCPTMPAPSPLDRERLIGYLLRQGCTRPGPLTGWLVRRETAYYDGPGGSWDCGIHAYCAARDAAVWQLGLRETAVLELLATEGWKEAIQ